MLIRPESPKDISGVYSVNKSAFESDAEAKLVDSLRINVKEVISLVAIEADQIVGHIMFSPVHISGNGKAKFYALAPMAVSPERQNQGIGSHLIAAGLDACKSQGVGAVFVLGHPDYYPRFGFKPSIDFGINSEYNVPAEVFMAIELEPGALKGFHGTVKYSSDFSEL